MLWGLVILFAMIAAVSTILLVLTKLEIRNMIFRFREISRNSSNQMLFLSAPNQQLEVLAIEINRLLEQKQALEIQYTQADRKLRQAVANISHDLRTPLTSIIGYLQLIQNEQLSIEERSAYIEIVLNRAKSLQMLICSFFDLSRLEAKEYSFDFKPISLAPILCELMASFYHDFADKGIEPTLSIDEYAPPIIGDENGIRRVFANLIQNALKHGEDFISVSLQVEDPYILVSFENAAPKLAPEDFPHLFDRFFIADRMRTGQNTGLGLAITKALVEQMGHRISSSFAEGKLSIMIYWIR